MNNLVYVINAVLSVILMLMYLKQKKHERKENSRLKEFSLLLESMFYQYTVYNNVEEAFQRSIETAEADIQEVAESMYEILIAEDEWKLRIEKKHYRCSFYYRFLIYSYLAMEYGDGEDSIYLENITYLKKQIFIWILNREKLEYHLAGLIGVVLIPLQCLKLIEIWAAYNLPELKRYYEFGYGIITRYLLLLITVLCYFAILLMRHNYEVHFYESRILTSISEQNMIRRGYEWWAEHNPKRVREVTGLLGKSSSRLTLAEYWLLQRSIFLTTAIVTIVVLSPMALFQMNRIVWVLSAASVIALLFSQIPKWSLRIRIQLMKGQKEDEAFFYYGIARMVALDGNGDVNEILDWMELSGEIFVPAVEVCMEEYMNDCEAAVEHVKMLEPFVPFVKLMDAFAVSEVTGLEEALAPLKQEYENHIEKRRQENEIVTENKGVLGRFVAFIPMACVIGLYLIIPFVLESLMQLQEYVKQIQTGF